MVTERRDTWHSPDSFPEPLTAQEGLAAGIGYWVPHQMDLQFPPSSKSIRLMLKIVQMLRYLFTNIKWTLTVPTSCWNSLPSWWKLGTFNRHLAVRSFDTNISPHSPWNSLQDWGGGDRWVTVMLGLSGRSAGSSSSGRSCTSTRRPHRRSLPAPSRSATWPTCSPPCSTASRRAATFLIRLREVCGGSYWLNPVTIGVFFTVQMYLLPTLFPDGISYLWCRFKNQL